MAHSYFLGYSSANYYCIGHFLTASGYEVKKTVWRKQGGLEGGLWLGNKIYDMQRPHRALYNTV